MTNSIINILPFYFLPFSLINYLLHLHLWSSVGVDGQQHNGHGHHRPNVLFLLADDLGFADLYWHDPSLHTPNLRRLAFSAHSVRLSNVYVGPLCTPSTRAAMLSGFYPFRTGTQDGVFLHSSSGALSPNVGPLLPELLRTLAGYRTHLIGKWHLGYCRREFLPTSRGFDTFYGYYGAQEGYFNHSTDFLDHHANGGRGMLLRGLDLFREHNGHSEPDWTANGIHSTDLFLNEAIRVISASKNASIPDHDGAAAPFFLLLSFQAVHAPLEVPQKWISLCPTQQSSPIRRLYCGLLAGMDQAIGHLVDHLRAIGQLDRTLIVFGTDNGGDPNFGASNWPLRGGKGQLWEGGTRSNAIIHWPAGIAKGGTRQNLFHAIDWPATLLGAAGIGIQRMGDGLNLWPMISGGEEGKLVAAQQRDEVIYAIGMPTGRKIEGEGGGEGNAMAAIRDRHLKLVLYSRGHWPFDGGRLPSSISSILLFNLTADPSERHDLALKMPEEVRRLKAKLVQLTRGKRRMPNAIQMHTDPRGWPQKHGGTFAGGWC